MIFNEIADEILGSKKYADIDRNVVERISAGVIPKYKSRKNIIKAIKKELHIIHESFLQDDCHVRAEKMIRNYSGDAMKKDKEFAIRLLSLHSSTKERLGQAEEIYDYISKFIEADDKVIDLGCGFNPLAIPYLAVMPSDYTAYDINAETIQTLNDFFSICGLPYRADICDAAIDEPDIHADVVLMLKLFPLLERQKKGRGFELIRTLNARKFIISFPLKSASGKEKGMEAYYSNYFEDGLPSEFSIVDRQMFYNEMFYILKTK